MAQVFENIRVLQLPPNPKEFDMTCMSSCFAYARTGTNPVSMIGFLNDKDGYISWFTRFRMEYTASTAPAAPSVCPVYDLVEEKGGTFSNSRIIARLSVSSLFSVPVPCALI